MYLDKAHLYSCSLTDFAFPCRLVMNALCRTAAACDENIRHMLRPHNSSSSTGGVLSFSRWHESPAQCHMLLRLAELFSPACVT